MVANGFRVSTPGPWMTPQISDCTDHGRRTTHAGNLPISAPGHGAADSIPQQSRTGERRSTHRPGVASGLLQAGSRLHLTATSVAPPPPHSRSIPRRSLRPTASRSKVCSPTTPSPNGIPGPFQQRCLTVARCSASRNLAGPRPRARSSASTGPWSRNGPTFARTPQTRDGPRGLDQEIGRAHV